MTDLVITAASVVAGSDATTERGTAGETIAAGKTVYKDSTTAKWKLSDSNSGTAEVRQATAIALHGASLDQPIVVQRAGDITIGATLVAGTTYYHSDTPGGICPLADVGTGEYVQIIGIAKTTAVLALDFRFPNVAL